MSDLISRKETIKYIRENLPLSTFMHRGVKQADIACWDVCNMIADRVPSAEPERKTGKWIEYPDCLRYEGAYTNDQIACSECHHVFSILDNCTEEFDFCPSCGADMRGEE